MGIKFHWVPGSVLLSEREKPNSETVEVTVEKGLFADDTSIVGKGRELEEGIRITKEIMGKFEERNNNHKEEILEFGKEGSNNIRMLGSYMGFKEDVNQRVRRGGAAWNKVKRQLKGSKLPKKVHARIVEACVESTMLYNAV